MYLNNKKILFIGPVFHDYHTAIINTLQNEGAKVIFHAERTYGPRFKITNNIFPGKLQQYQEQHYASILNKVSDTRFDYLFVIKGFMMPASFITAFREKNPGAKAIMYQWDSNRTNKFVHLIPYFDKVYSFDFEDCEQNPTISYLSLFYTDDVLQQAAKKEEIKYDCFFMGWYIPERYNAALRFRDYANARGLRLKAFIYLPFTSYIKERLKGIKPDRSIVSFRHMPRKEYLSLLGQSSIMVDVSNKNQTGMAMRIIEALACNKKVLTNNRRLKDDPVYSPENIGFFDDNSPEVTDTFYNAPVKTDQRGVYALKDWIKQLFIK